MRSSLTPADDHSDALMANTQALQDLENGATGLSLVFAGGCGAHGLGLDQTASVVARVLKDVQLDGGIDLELQIGTNPRKTSLPVTEYMQTMELDKSPARSCPASP